MAPPLMPKATAVWLVDNTTLTFDQIAKFCGLHHLEVQGIADGEVAVGIQGLDPVANSQLTREEIEHCEKDPSRALKILKLDLPEPAKRTKGPRYTPVAKRQDKPDAIAWLLRHHPELKDSQIAKLIGTTKTTIQAVHQRRCHSGRATDGLGSYFRLGFRRQLCGLVRDQEDPRNTRFRRRGIRGCGYL